MSRAAYKLLDIQKKYRVLRPGETVLDLGCAPGGWLQVASKIVGPKGAVVGIDRLALQWQPAPNVRFLQKVIEAVVESEWPVELDCVLSDISPDLSGISFRDLHQSFLLASQVWQIAKRHLKKGGHLVVKIFPSQEAVPLQRELKSAFRQSKTYIPEATRKASSEVYWVALGYKL